MSSGVILVYTASLAMKYSPASSASVADVMTCLMMCAILSTASLFGGIDELRALGLLR